MQAITKPIERILRLPEVKTLTGLSRSSIYAYIKADNFPKNLSLGERSVGWYESEVMDCITPTQSKVEGQ